MTGRRARSRVRSRSAEDGYVAVLVATFVFALFFALAAISVDVSSWYVEMQRVQKAADAGALGGVTYMPQDLASARATAKDVSARNGYPDGGKISVDAEPGEKPSELAVTVSSEIPNTFGQMFGVDKITISEKAVADYTGPQPMGSPCNTFGNEPSGTPAFGPTTSQLSSPVGASCEQFPEYWPSVAGPEVAKTQGEQFGTRYCSSGESSCNGAANSDYSPLGYFMLVRVQPAAVNRTVRVQLYDPAYVATGSECDEIPTSLSTNGASNSPNPYVTDGRTRYDDSANAFCAGDEPNNGNGQRRGNEVPTVTSFGLRAPTDSLVPTEASPVTGCTRQYPGYTVPTTGQLRNNGASYDDNLARVFHQWKQLCTFTPSRAGDYYLQVRTNVPLGGSVNDDGSYKPPNAAASAMFMQTGDNSTMKQTGTNRFAVRAFIDGGTNASVSVSAYERMPVFANTTSSTPEFNLLRVLPGGAGKTLIFTFFDVGDAATSGTLTVLRPGDATGDTLKNCQAVGYKALTLPTCSLSGISNSSGWNGKIESIYVPIPSNYSCDYSSTGGCWFKIRVSFGSGSVTDATTWSASVSGDPVRLIE